MVQGLTEDEFRELAPDEGMIQRSWRSNKPAVSILCATYNHEKFVFQALAGLLRQDTEFPFEILVRDDASTDATPTILRNFQRHFPSIVRLHLEEQNRFHETSAYDVLIPHARGEFITTCEGDDYWIDPTKLKKQVRALADQPRAVAAFHRVNIWNESTQTLIHPVSTRYRNCRSREWLRDPALPSQSLLFRNIVPAYPSDFPRIINTDTYIQVRLALQGDAIFLPDINPGTYRIHEGGTWSQLETRRQAIAQTYSFYWIGCELIDEGRVEEGKLFLALAAQAIVESHIDEGVDPRTLVSLRNSFVARILGDLSHSNSRLRSIFRRVKAFSVPWS